MNTPAVDHLPPLLHDDVQGTWQDFLEVADANLLEQLSQRPKVQESIAKIWGCSPFISQQCIRFPSLLLDLLQTNALETPPAPYLPILQQQLNAITEEEPFLKCLRDYRRREMVRIAWRDIMGWADIHESLASLSNLADAFVEAANDWLYSRLCTQYGTPCNDKGEAQKMIVLGMGKLGGQELNFSSDIDLIFTFPETGETQGSTRRTRTNQEFFVRLGQQLVNALNSNTVDGFVYRVDMRLRPFGDSGPLAMHFDAIEDYYQVHARDWERYALVKARVCAGNQELGAKLLEMLRPFIYRRYLDYHAFDALRSMKAMIDQETRRRGLENNLKLGIGGIREVEFTCQVFQLIRGGRLPALQVKHLLSTIDALEEFEFFSAEVAEKLRNAYCFLRLAENHLQAMEDRQTQTLPDTDLNQVRLAVSMGFATWEAFMAALAEHQNFVQAQFTQVIAPEVEENAQEAASSHWKTMWLHQLQDDDANLECLQEGGFADSSAILTHLRKLADAHSIQKLTGRGREILDILIPLVLETSLQYKNKDNAVHATLDFIESVARRSVYLSLLIERPQVLQQLMQLCAESVWITDQITRYPILLDELLDHRRLYDPLKPAELDNALQAQLAHLPIDDLEMQMDSLRQFKRAYVLQVAAAEIGDKLTVEVASDYLAAIADTLVRQALHMAWEHLTQKHGIPQYMKEGEMYNAGFCVIAYGKAGGIELSYSSDLDIVFLHDSHGEQQYTNGRKSIDNQVFFVRLAQRIIHIISTNMSSGMLYEVDPRLRPGGNSGLLVSSIASFEQYQHEEAWTWEHQALVRARGIAGNTLCIEQFEKIRRDIMQKQREDKLLREEVCEMRGKMRDSLDKSNADIFDVKQGVGGIADIEFMVQYGVLRWAKEYPSLMNTTGMLPMLKLFKQYGLLTDSACERLSTAYREYRSETHRCALQKTKPHVDHSLFTLQRNNVKDLWQKIILRNETVE